ncbi:MAG: heavy-metal-associated domain-containing protein, partial [Planctomycetes bacterium]|nr:heavy-metal-associated domain-containing protein [Planctomycetota bacterium]
MLSILRSFTAASLVLGIAAAAPAADVTVKNVHLCCGQCVTIVGKAMKDVEGVSGIVADRDGKTVTFKAADDKAAEAGIKALAGEGFYGTATHGEKKLKFPESGAKEGQKADKVVLTGVHLCCGACAKGVQEALKDLKGAEQVDVDRDEKTVTIS